MQQSTAEGAAQSHMMSLWPGALLLVLLSVGSSQPVEENWVTGIMNTLLSHFGFKGQLCMIANIPTTTEPKDLLNNFKNDDYDAIRDIIGKDTNDPVNDVYVGTNLIVARLGSEGHAEYRAMDHVKLLSHNQRQTDRTFLMYSYLSPCGDHCTNPAANNILQPFEDHVKKYWKRYIFVFNKVFDNPRAGEESSPKQISPEELKKALERLKKAGFGENIFRCHGEKWGEFKCQKCFSGNQLNDICINNKATSGGQRGNSPTQGQGGSSGSSDIGGQGQGSSAGGKRQHMGQDRAVLLGGSGSTWGRDRAVLPGGRGATVLLGGRDPDLVDHSGDLRTQASE
ncbi:hypothetical protein INR49_031414 [Caranx melampygus]|nr:hypothetical protein INR49_031414 [Caranx melampygus]